VELRYGSTICLTSELDRTRQVKPPPESLNPPRMKETLYPLYKRPGGIQGRSGKLRKISSPSPGFDSRIAQHVASRYTFSWPIFSIPLPLLTASYTHLHFTHLTSTKTSRAERSSFLSNGDNRLFASEVIEVYLFTGLCGLIVAMI